MHVSDQIDPMPMLKSADRQVDATMQRAKQILSEVEEVSGELVRRLERVTLHRPQLAPGESLMSNDRAVMAPLATEIDDLADRLSHVRTSLVATLDALEV